MTQTIAQQIKWDFKANRSLEILDKDNNQIYFEHSDGYWEKREYDSQDNLIYFEDSNGYWRKHQYDSLGNEIYHEDSFRYWSKREWDSEGNQIYYENSNGEIEDNRPKPLEIEVTTTKTYKVGDPVECLTYDGWMDGEIKDIDLSKRILSVYVEDYDEIHKFTTNQIK